MRYTLNGLVFDPDLGPDANGFEWIINELEGWDSPEMRLQLLNPTAVHGAVIGQSLYGPRPMTASGWIGVPDEPGFWAARNILATATNLVTASADLVVHEAVPKKCRVQRADKLRMRNHPDVLVVEFAIPLIAVDPRKYALDGTVVSLP